MKNRKSFKTLAEELKKIRQRPIPPKEIEEFNRIVEHDDAKEKPSNPNRKVGRSPEVNN